MPRTVFAGGPVSVLTKETDGSIWIPASDATIYGGTWVNTRIAAGNYAMIKNAADEAGQIVFDLTKGLLTKIGTDPTSVGSTSDMAAGAHDIRGVQIQSIDVVFQNITAALDAHTYDIHTAAYVNNIAVVLASTFGGTLTGTLATATQANPYVTRITLGTPSSPGLNSVVQNTNLEISWDAAPTSVLTYYGIFLNVHYNLL